MIFRDTYEIEIESNGTSIVIDPKDISFTISENLYNIYSTGLIELLDSTGMIQESLLTTKGSEVNIVFGNVDHELRVPMMVLNDRTEEEPVQHGFLSTKVIMPLIHRWYKEQSIISRAYRGEISSIVRNIVRSYNLFDEIDIETTIGSDTWYQCNIDDVSFIEDQLLPNAFSFNAESTPFCAYITNDNVFHLTHMKRLFNENISATLDFSQRANIETISENPVMSIRRIKDKTDYLENLSTVRVYQINRNNGRLESSDDLITDHSPPASRKLPYVGSINDGVSSVLDLDYIEPNSNQENNNLGQTIFNQRNAMFLDRMSVVIPLNSKLRCGQKVQLNIDSSLDDSQSKYSNIFTSSFIIEALDHIWNGDSQMGYTKLLLGRKYIAVPQNYAMVGRMAP